MGVFDGFSNFFGWLAGFFMSFGDLSMGNLRDFIGGHGLNYPFTNLVTGAKSRFIFPGWSVLLDYIGQIPLVGAIVNWVVGNIVNLLYGLFDMFFGTGSIYSIPIFSFQFLSGGIRCVVFMFTVIMLVKLVYSLIPHN